MTIGSAAPFEELLEEVDTLAGESFFGDEVVMQTGHSAYVPLHCEHFRFHQGLEAYFDRAACLFIHGGVGSTIEALMSGKPFIAFANPRVAADHQGEFLERMSKEYDIVWTRNCKDLRRLYPTLEGRKPLRRSRYAESLVAAILERARA